MSWCMIFCLQLQDLALLLAELHELPISPFLQPAKVPLDSSITLCSIYHSWESGAVCRLAEGKLQPIIQIISGMLGNTDLSGTLLVTGIQLHPATGHHTLDTTVQPLFNPPHCLLIQPTHQQLLCKDLTGDSVKGLTEVQTDNIHCPSLFYQANHFTMGI